MITSTFFAKFQLDYVIMYILQTRMIFHVLVAFCSANRNNFKLSQLGDLTMFSQSSKFQPKRLATAVFILWFIFFESG